MAKRSKGFKKHLLAESCAGAAMLHFMSANAQEREQMFEHYDHWLAEQEGGQSGKKAFPPPTAERQRRVG